MIILVAGGTGFLGERVVKSLEARGHKVVVYHRGHRAIPTHVDAIVNCIGIIREDEETFKEAHVDVTRFLLRLGRKLRIRQFVQVSALGVERESTPYQRSKLQAERLVEKSRLPYAILRPSLIAGDGGALKRFRAVARTGFFPLFGNAQVQPVHVETVAAAVVAAVERRIRDRTAELGGPEIFTYASLADRIHPGVRAFRMPFPGLFTRMAPVFRALPTRDMVTMLGQDNVTKDRTLERLKIRNPRVV